MVLEWRVHRKGHFMKTFFFFFFQFLFISRVISMTPETLNALESITHNFSSSIQKVSSAIVEMPEKRESIDLVR